jgi:Histidine kinase-, DNA gyrase B-, and HSP90-like ATPase
MDIVLREPARTHPPSRRLGRLRITALAGGGLAPPGVGGGPPGGGARAFGGGVPGGGSGLGLSIAAAVVQAHHGWISVERTPGGGATFRMALPLREPA